MIANIISSPNEDFFDGYLNAGSKIHDLSEFKEYSTILLKREKTWLEEEAHIDLEQEFLPLFTETFPPILHSSIVISSIILLEDEMKIFSGLLDKHLGNKLTLNDLSGSLLEKFKKHVTGLASLDFDFTSLNWQDVKGLYEVRNCLVHNGSSLTNFSRAKAIYDFSSRHHTPLQQNDTLILNEESSDIAISTISAFIENIYASALRQFPGKHKIPIFESL